MIILVEVDFKKMRRLREEQGMSTVEVAEKTGRTNGFISKIERGLQEPGVQLLAMMAGIYGVTVDELLIKETA